MVRAEAEKDLAGTLAELAGIGYQAVEFHQYYGKTAAELRAMLQRCGLTPLSGTINILRLDEYMTIIANTIERNNCK